MGVGGEEREWIYQTMQLMEDCERGARRREVGMLEEAALGWEEGVPGCVCGVGGRGAEARVIVECPSRRPYCGCIIRPTRYQSIKHHFGRNWVCGDDDGLSLLPSGRWRERGRMNGYGRGMANSEAEGAVCRPMRKLEPATMRRNSRVKG